MNWLPSSGHVSNSCGRVGRVIEPMDTHCFESDPCDGLTRVHGRRPVWTRLELADGGRITSGSHVVRAESGEEYWPRDLPEGGRRMLSNDQAPSGVTRLPKARYPQRQPVA